MPTDKKISELPIAASVNASDISVLVNSGTDYQYTFTLLLQFLQANLSVGANISFGSTLPQNTSGKNGDVFINTTAGSFAQKTAGAWAVVYILPAASAADGTLLYGAGMPGAATGKNQDTYINTLTGIFYQKSAEGWSQVFSMATGPQGPQGSDGLNGTNGVNGNTILFGAVNPSNSATGTNGDFYLNTSNYTLFGPKAAGVWSAGVSLLGTGIPGGGTTGQILVKADNTDFNTAWKNNSFADITGEPADNTNLAAALATKQDTLGYIPENNLNKGIANGYASLDGTGKVPSTQLPGFVDEVIEVADFAALPATGAPGTIYITIDTNKEYRWGETLYVEIVASPGSTDAVPGDSQFQGYEVNEYFKSLDVKNRGIYYDTSFGVLYRSKDFAEGKPAKVFIEIGVNDLEQHTPINTIGNNVFNIIETIKQNSPNTKIYLLSILPTLLVQNQERKALNKIYSQIANNNKAEFIDLDPFYIENGLIKKYDVGDGLHLNAKGYSKLTEILLPFESNK